MYSLYVFSGTNPSEYVKVGAAIVESAQGPSKFNLILYYTREKLVAMAPITSEFSLTLQLQDGVNFGSFYDASQKLWSFRFFKQEDVDQLAIFVTVAKFHEDGPTAQLTQDIGALTKGSGTSSGDILGVRYVSYAENSGKIEVIEDSSSKLSKYIVGGGAQNKVGNPSWDTGLEGLKRGGKRVILTPNDNGSGGATIFKIFLEKTKKAATESAPSSGKLPKATAAAPEHEANETLESGSPVSENSNAILQRMSKMAVATPFAGAVKSSLPSDAPSSPSAAPAATPVAAEPEVVAAQPQAAAPAQAVPQQPMQQPQQPQQYPQQPMGAAPNGGMYGSQFGGAPMNYQAPGSMYGNMSQQAPYGAMNGPYGAYGMPNGASFGSQSALSLYNPQQQQHAPWDMPWSAHVAAAAQAAASAQTKEAKKEEAAPAAPAKPESVLSQAEAIQLLIDGRQFQSEIKQTLTKMTTQLEDVEERLEGTMFSKQKEITGGVTAKVLLQSVARIVGENEKMLEEISSRDSRIDSLTLKLNALHDTNQRVIDENTKFMEERTTGFKQATDSQLRQLETFREEKTQLEMELTSANRQFQTLKRSFTNVSTELETLKEEMERLKGDRDNAVSKYAGVAGASQSAEAKLIEETSLRRKLELDSQQLRDELHTEKETTDLLRRDVEDKKTKYVRELANIETQHATEKATLEETIGKLQDALKKERATLGASSEAAQAEIETKWTSRFQADVQRLQSKLEAEWEAKFESQKSSIETEFRDRLRSLKVAAEEAEANSLAEFEQERTTYREREQQFRKRISELTEIALSTEQAQQVISKLRTDIVEIQAASAANIKGIMNDVYVSLNGLFEEGESVQYDKTGIMHTLRSTIVSTTKRLTNPEDEVIPIARPEPVAPVRIEVPVEVPVVQYVEVPSKKATQSEDGEEQNEVSVHVKHSFAASSESESALSHPNGHITEEGSSLSLPALTRVDSEPQFEVSKSPSPSVDSEVAADDDVLEDDPLAPAKDEDEDDVSPPMPAVPVDDGWEALAQEEPDFVQPKEESSDEPSSSNAEAEIDPLSQSSHEEDDSKNETANHVDSEAVIDPLSQTEEDDIFSPLHPAPADDDIDNPLSQKEEDSEDVSAPITSNVEEEKVEESKNEDSAVEENPLAPSSENDKEDDEPIAENPLSASSADDEEGEKTFIESNGHVDISSPVVADEEPTQVSEPEVLVTEPENVVEPETEANGDGEIEHESPAPTASASAIIEPPTPVVVASTIRSALPEDDDDDDDPFGVNDSPKKPAATAVISEPATPVKEEIEEEKVAAPAEDDKEEDKPNVADEPFTPAERPVSPPNFFLDANGSTSASTPGTKKKSVFDDEDDSFSTPTAASKASVPATEPKKKSSSFFDDEDSEAAVVPKKAPSSASKASFALDDDDFFSKPSTKKSGDALDDIFGGISSKGGSSVKKGLFDD